ncbi:MAG TPA: caspase family protein [Acidimicrobiales bacterium]|nr:caspase family protein [Acidimicrobiales bacterium]
MKKVLAIVAATMVAAPLAAASAAPAPEARKTALIIGIGEYQGRTVSLPGSAGDAALLRDTLLANGWEDANINYLVNETATAANIRGALGWLVDQSTDDGFSVFAYSGHVKQKSGDLDGDGELNDEFLWPHDNSFISDGELAASLNALRGDAWINIAGCEAAGFDDGVNGPRRLFTAASHEPEKGYEHPEWQLSVHNGLMVRDALAGGQGDSDGNGAVSIQEALAYTATIAPELTATQRYGPQHPYINGGDGGEWFLSPPPPPPAPPAADGGGLLSRLLGRLLG